MRVEFNNPEFPEGMEVEVGGILLVNGESVEIDEDALSFFEAREGRSYREALQTVQFVKVDGASFVPSAPVEAVEETTGDDENEAGDN